MGLTSDVFQGRGHNVSEPLAKIMKNMEFYQDLVTMLSKSNITLTKRDSLAMSSDHSVLAGLCINGQLQENSGGFSYY